MKSVFNKIIDVWRRHIFRKLNMALVTEKKSITNIFF